MDPITHLGSHPNNYRPKVWATEGKDAIHGSMIKGAILHQENAGDPKEKSGKGYRFFPIAHIKLQREDIEEIVDCGKLNLTPIRLGAVRLIGSIMTTPGHDMAIVGTYLDEIYTRLTSGFINATPDPAHTKNNKPPLAVLNGDFKSDFWF